MKKIDISKQIMDKVVSYEKRKYASWLGLFVLLGLILFLLWLSVSRDLIGKISQAQTWDLLSLFREDWEIVSEYWQDTLLVFLMELPRIEVILSLIMLVTIYLYFKTNRMEWKLWKKKLGKIKEYLTKRNDAEN